MADVVLVMVNDVAAKSIRDDERGRERQKRRKRERKRAQQSRGRKERKSRPRTKPLNTGHSRSRRWFPVFFVDDREPDSYPRSHGVCGRRRALWGVRAGGQFVSMPFLSVSTLPPHAPL